MLTKKEFIEDAMMMQGTKTPAVSADKIQEAQFWAAQYDLYAKAYRGPHLHDTTMVLCSTANQLETPAESLDQILVRLGEKP
jgi:hypothetical protein